MVIDLILLMLLFVWTVFLLGLKLLPASWPDWRKGAVMGFIAYNLFYGMLVLDRWFLITGSGESNLSAWTTAIVLTPMGLLIFDVAKAFGVISPDQRWETNFVFLVYYWPIMHLNSALAAAIGAGIGLCIRKYKHRWLNP